MTSRSQTGKATWQPARRGIVDPILTAALLVLAGWAADPAFVTPHWHQLAG